MSEPASDLLAPLPTAVRALAGKAEHPGLWLDKYARTWKPVWIDGMGNDSLSADVQKPALVKVVELTQQAAGKAASDFAAALSRHTAMLDAMRARPFTATTTGPLTLHLARAAALENAGLALHPLYGFAYLPATGLKGMARAYAEAVWLPSLPEAEQRDSWHLIEDVFGWAPTPERRDRLRAHPEHRRFVDDDPTRAEITASAGQVVFHDAWPEAWPQLLVDIVNNHHPDYYEADEKRESVPPPGDWENPRPVYFLAVEPGTQFRFALAPARRDADPELLEQAEEWLLGALTHEGAGAKTAAGYGRFRADEPAVQARTPELPEATRAVFETELELVTPAFLAGAEQTEKDCDLRPATLRGLLRWWWRTLHAGFVTPAELRALETAVWGSAEVGGAVRIAVEAVERDGPYLYNYKDSAKRFRPKPEFKRERGLADSPNSTTTQGLFYLSYGMDEEVRERGAKVLRQRWFLAPGSTWRVRVTTRASCYPADPKAKNRHPISAEEVLSQAVAALWLLCHNGGVGSKARKGFGSLAQPEGLTSWSLDRCLAAAAELRAMCGLPNAAGSKRVSPAPESVAPWGITADVAVASHDPWQVLDALGFSYQNFAQRYAHREDKAALGLPRKIHGPNTDPMRSQRADAHEAPVWLRSPRWNAKTNPQKARFASPAHLHLSSGANGATIRITVFPVPDLPDLTTSRRVLEELVTHLQADLPARLAGRRQAARTPHGNRTEHSSQRAAPAGISTGDVVEVELLEEKTKKGGWKARHAASGRTGHIVNWQSLPSDASPGDRVRLRVDSVSADGKTLIFSVP